MKKIFILFLLLPFFANSQNPQIKKTIKQIKIDKNNPVQSVFEWVATNVKYDVKKLRKVIKTGNKTTMQTVDDRINDVLKTRKGVCQHYSELFAALLKELGYEAIVVSGFTNKTNIAGENTSLGHAWNAIKVNGEWKLYDPTWAAGGVRNGKKFIKDYNDAWHDVHPREMIKTHIPFDPMWQLLEKPLSYKRFLDFQFVSDYPATLNYTELIDQHLTKTKADQYDDAVKRSKTLGQGNPLLKQWAHMLTSNAQILRKNKTINSRNEHVKSLNEGVNIMKLVNQTFNKYITVKNKQFKDKHWTESRLKQTMQKLQQQTSEAIKIYSGVKSDDPEVKMMINKSMQYATNLLKRINKETLFIQQKFK